jgi:hypothetical protein
MIWQADLIDCWSRHHSFSSLLIESFARRTANSGILPPAAELFAYSVRAAQIQSVLPRQPSSGAAGPGRVSGLYEQALAMPSILFLSSASEG